MAVKETDKPLDTKIAHERLVATVLAGPSQQITSTEGRLT